MGPSFSAFFDIFRGKQDARILLLGLDAAGKTTITYKLSLNELVTTIPTIGFNVEKIEYKNLKMTMWDIGGQDRLRTLWKHYYQNSNAVIFVVDSSDKTRMKIAREELHKVMEAEELKDCKLLVYANKQDLPGALAPSEVGQALQLTNLKHTWFIQGASASTGHGLYEGLNWLSSQLK